MAQPGQLYVVATPIGNLDDITIRALAVLQAVDKVAAEDTRHSMILLDHHGIHQSMVPIHEHNEEKQIPKLIHFIEKGHSVALVSDAGTPLISDPGFRLVQACQKAGITVVPVPGACAAIAALSAAGLPTDRFTFAGFLPIKLQARKKALQALAKVPETLIFYESPRRVMTTLAQMAEVFGPERSIVIAKELTKAHESVVLRTIEQAIAWLSEDDKRQKGEFVLLVGGHQAGVDEEELQACQKMLTALLPEVSLKKAVDLTTSLTGSRRKMVYEMALSMASDTL